MFFQQHFCGRPQHQSRGFRKSGLSHTLHPPFLRDIRCDTEKPRQSRVFSRPLARSDVVRVGGKLDNQVTDVHRTAIPLQPETHMPLSCLILCYRIGPEVVPVVKITIASQANFPQQGAITQSNIRQCCVS